MEHNLSCTVFNNLRSLEPIQHLIDLRLEIFSEELGFTVESEIDEHDLEATHLDVRLEGKLVGTARVYDANGKLWMGRIAVKKEYRGLGIAKFIIKFLKEEANRLGYREIHLYAMDKACSLYNKTGAVVTGPEFLLDEHPHVPMMYKLDDKQE